MNWVFDVVITEIITNMGSQVNESVTQYTLLPIIMLQLYTIGLSMSQVIDRLVEPVFIKYPLRRQHSVSVI